MSPSTASTRRAAAAATLHLPFRVPAKEMIPIKEVAAITGLSISAVEKLYELGQFTGHSHNGGSGLRDTKRILRVSFVAYMMRTADYTDEAIFESYIGCLHNLSEQQLAGIRTAIAHELTRRANS